MNDTLTGDPLMTVPIWTDPDVEPGDDIESLCYEVHGEDDAYFNLISDGCTSVNAYYQEAITPSDNINLNVVTQIGVRARGNNNCWNIRVNLDTCSARVNGNPLVGNNFDGIMVRPYPTSSRVRISVPNCADNMLVMWVFCRTGQVEDPVTWEYFDIRFIRFVVMRGLNLSPKSHGIIGTVFTIHLPQSSKHVPSFLLSQGNSGMFLSLSRGSTDHTMATIRKTSTTSLSPQTAPQLANSWVSRKTSPGNSRLEPATMSAMYREELLPRI